MIQRAGAASPILRVDAISETIKCPDRRCGMPVVGQRSSGPYCGALRCQTSSCRTRWFVEPLVAGDVRAQLAIAYEDLGIVEDLMTRLRLPRTLDRAAYLQIPLNGDLWTEYVRDRSGTPRDQDRRLLGLLLGRRAKRG